MKHCSQKLGQNEIDRAVQCLRHGGVIAYPTEAVFGFGCDPMNVDAISKILQLKHRPISKGFILVASNWNQLMNYVEPIEPKALTRVLASWPGPVTWTFPANQKVPAWIRGEHNTVAVRVTDHPVAKALCSKFGSPIVSTSANREGQPPIREEKTVQMAFGKAVDMVVSGKVGDRIRPTEIRNAITGEVIRAG